MNKTIKILLGIGILLLLIGAATAAETDNLKTPAGFEELDNGLAKDTIEPNVLLYVGPNEPELFTNITDEGYSVSEYKNNTYVYVDTLLHETGVQELVKIDGKEYLVSISKTNWDSDASNPDDVKLVNSFYDQLINFNIINNLETVEV